MTDTRNAATELLLKIEDLLADRETQYARGERGAAHGNQVAAFTAVHELLGPIRKLFAESAQSEIGESVRNAIIEECARVGRIAQLERRLVDVVIRKLKSPAPQVTGLSPQSDSVSGEPAVAGPSNAGPTAIAHAVSNAWPAINNASVSSTNDGFSIGQLVTDSEREGRGFTVNMDAGPQADSLHGGDHDSGNHVQPAEPAPSIDECTAFKEHAIADLKAQLSASVASVCRKCGNVMDGTTKYCPGGMDEHMPAPAGETPRLMADDEVMLNQQQKIDQLKHELAEANQYRDDAVAEGVRLEHQLTAALESARSATTAAPAWETPRTDAVTHSHNCGAYDAGKGHHCDCDIDLRLREHARQLERELAAAQADLTRAIANHSADLSVQSASVPTGWRLVPEIVTDEIRREVERWAANRPHLYVQEMWNDVLAVASSDRTGADHG